MTHAAALVVAALLRVSWAELGALRPEDAGTIRLEPDRRRVAGNFFAAWPKESERRADLFAAR